MTTDPTLPRYGDLTILGTTPTALAPVLTGHLAAPWSRVDDIEESWSERGAGSGQPLVFRHEASGRVPAALLYLFARQDGGLYVSNIVPAEGGQLTEAKYNRLLRDFHDTAVEPAVRELGAKAILDIANYDLAERAGQEVRDTLVRFSRLANKGTGASHPLDAERFDDFVIATSQVAPRNRPTARTIAEWLVADGWSDDTAWDLAIQYERGLRLLDRASHG